MRRRKQILRWMTFLSLLVSAVLFGAVIFTTNFTTTHRLEVWSFGIIIIILTFAFDDGTRGD